MTGRHSFVGTTDSELPYPCYGGSAVMCSQAHTLPKEEAQRPCVRIKTSTAPFWPEQ
jgi:hypothetical protein